MDAPYHGLQPLPRTLWLPTLITAVGASAPRLADVQRWRLALLEGALPDDDAHFGDADDHMAVAHAAPPRRWVAPPINVISPRRCRAHVAHVAHFITYVACFALGP